MKYLVLISILFCNSVFAQLKSGDYGELKIAYSQFSRYVTGYYENHTGFDEVTRKPKFSCVFYFIGNLASSKAVITTYYPLDTVEIIGMLELADSNGIKISLPKEHGGCWNVQHFADEPVEFKLQQKTPWIEIRYVTIDKTHFHSGPPSSKMQQNYIVKGDIVYIQKQLNDWVYCTYFGQREITGWIRVSDLNEIKY